MSLSNHNSAKITLWKGCRQHLAYALRYISGIIQCMFFYVWLLSLNIMSMRFTHFITYSRSLFISLLCNILLYKILSDVLLIDIWIVSSFLLLWIKLAQTCLYMSFGGHKHLFLLGVYPGMELLGQSRYKYLALIDIAKQFSLLLTVC